MKREHVTADELRELIRYEPATGVFTWIRARPGTTVGSEAGCIDKDGYRVIRVFQRTYFAHRLVWLYVYGKWPEQLIDHANGNKLDNRLSNLRECNASENAQNRTERGRGCSPLVGVGRSGNKWFAQIMLNRKAHRVGNFDTQEEAHEAYLRMKAEMHTFSPTLRSASA